MNCVESIDTVDKRITGILFSTKLFYFEHLFFPFFAWAGQPICFLMIFPTALWCAITGSWQSGITLVAVTVLSFCIVFCWMKRFIEGLTKTIFFYGVPIVYGVGIIAYGMVYNRSILNVLYLYGLSMIVASAPMTLLKIGFHRRRPLSFPEFPLEGRRLPFYEVYFEYLTKSEPNSFPSGDVTAAACFAVALAHVLGPWPLLLILVSAYGRIYYGAHHLLDVLFGAALGLASSITVWFVGTTYWPFFGIWVGLNVALFAIFKRLCRSSKTDEETTTDNESPKEAPSAKGSINETSEHSITITTTPELQL